MRLDKARESWDRANRTLVDLTSHASRADEHAFTDLVPYVLDLLDGVARQIKEYRPKTPEFGNWWPNQWSTNREAIHAMRNAQLKRLERGTSQVPQTTPISTPGTFMGLRVFRGDTVAWHEWHFVDGYFDGQEVMAVLRQELENMAKLIEEAEARLS